MNIFDVCSSNITVTHLLAFFAGMSLWALWSTFVSPHLPHHHHQHRHMKGSQ